MRYGPGVTEGAAIFRPLDADGPESRPGDDGAGQSGGLSGAHLQRRRAGPLDAEAEREDDADRGNTNINRTGFGFRFVSFFSSISLLCIFRKTFEHSEKEKGLFSPWQRGVAGQ